MYLCKQPFTQVSRGGTEREHTFTPFLTVMIQKSRPAPLHFSRHCWSGGLLFTDQVWGKERLPPSRFPLVPRVTPSPVTLQGQYQHPKLILLLDVAFCLLSVSFHWNGNTLRKDCLSCSLPDLRRWGSVLDLGGLLSK